MKEGQSESLRIHSFMSVSASLKLCLASRGLQITQLRRRMCAHDEGSTSHRKLFLTELRWYLHMPMVLV